MPTDLLLLLAHPASAPQVLVATKALFLLVVSVSIFERADADIVDVRVVSEEGTDGYLSRLVVNTIFDGEAAIAHECGGWARGFW